MPLVLGSRLRLSPLHWYWMDPCAGSTEITSRNTREMECKKRLRLEGNQLVVDAVGIEGGEKAVEQFPAVLRQEVGAGKLALLQCFVVIEGVAQQASVALGDFALAEFGAGGAGTQRFQLMQHFGFGILRRIDQRLVEPLQAFRDRRHGTRNAGLRLLERGLKFGVEKM